LKVSHTLEIMYTTIVLTNQSQEQVKNRTY